MSVTLTGRRRVIPQQLAWDTLRDQFSDFHVPGSVLRYVFTPVDEAVNRALEFPVAVGLERVLRDNWYQSR